MTATTATTLADAVSLCHQVASGADGLSEADLADAAVLVQDVIAQLRQIELDLCAALGQRTGPTTGNVSDGRQYTLRRSPDRKDWDHEGWKHDVRRILAARYGGDTIAVEDGQIIDCETGEQLTLARLVQQVLIEAQEVHGSTAPRMSSLRALGLHATDYCTSTPGGWRMSTVRPNEADQTGATS